MVCNTRAGVFATRVLIGETKTEAFVDDEDTGSSSREGGVGGIGGAGGCLGVVRAPTTSENIALGAPVGVSWSS